MNHSPEPWRTAKIRGFLTHPKDFDRPKPDITVYGPSDKAFGYFMDIALCCTEEDAERIAACVNALAGIEDPRAYTKSVEALVWAVKASRIVPYPALQQLCDEVLEHRQFEIPS